MEGPLKNSRHEKFAVLVASGKTQADAYRDAFPASNEWKPQSVNQKASTLAAKLRGRIRELQEKIVESIAMTKTEALGILAEGLRRADLEKMSPTAAYSELAKSLGWYEPEKSVVDHRISADEAVAARIGAELARLRTAKK